MESTLPSQFGYLVVQRLGGGSGELARHDFLERGEPWLSVVALARITVPYRSVPYQFLTRRDFRRIPRSAAEYRG
jgi:hypothetical protein